MKPLEAAARSRSEADWVVGMNATRAASIRLRAAFDGAVSLGRVQTPTLALVARREEEIRAFKPEPYWLVEGALRGFRRAALQRPLPGRQAPAGGGRGPRPWSPPWRASRGEITKLEKKEERERPQLLYDLTSLQRHANTLYGFSARRTLAAAQRLYEEHKALTYPRTNSRFLTGDMIAEIKPTAELVGQNAAVRAGRREYVTSLERLPLGRVVNDKKVEDHHAIIPTRSEHDLGRMGQDELKVYDLVAKRFLGGLPPRGGVRAHARGDHGRRARVPHERPPADRARLEGRLRRGGRRPAAPRTTPAATSCCPSWSRARRWRRSRSSRCARRPSRRGASRDASLLGAMETAGKDVEDAELREAMKDSGIGTPATRAAHHRAADRPSATSSARAAR